MTAAPRQNCPGKCAIDGSHDGNLHLVAAASPAQEPGKIGTRTPHAHADLETDSGQYDLRKHIDEVALELRTAHSDARHGAPVQARRPSKAFRTAQESIDNQRFRRRVALSAHSHLDDEHTSMGAVCMLNNKELVLLGGPELTTSLLAVPLSHIVIDVQAGLDMVFCVTGCTQKLPPTSRAAQLDSRVFLHVRTDVAREAWLAVLHEFKADIQGWVQEPKASNEWDDESQCPASCSFSAGPQSFASSKIDNPIKIGFGKCSLSCSAGEGVAVSNLVDSLQGRRLSLNNALPLVIWLPE